MAKRVACLLLGQRLPSIQTLAEACGRFSPQIALREDEAVFIEVGGSRNLFTEESLRARLLALSRRFTSAECRVAIADDAPTALGFARYGVSRKQDLPLEVVRDYAQPFTLDLDSLKPLSRAIQVLKVMGLKTLGDLLILPEGSLASRFGKEAVDIRARIDGRLSVAWPGFHPAEKITEKSDQGGENVEALIFILRGLVDRAMARLRGRCERVAVLEFRLELERWSMLTATESFSRVLRIEFALPQGAVNGVLPIVQEKLSRHLDREPLLAPVDHIAIEIIETAPGRGAQRDFFSPKEEQDEELESLFSRLASKIGKESAFVARPVERYLPEGVYSRSLSFGELPALEKGPVRPVRLLKKPEQVLLEGNILVRPRGRRWRVIDWMGPERISGEWWRRGFDRDYYQVVTEGGERLWVFECREAGGLFLHGYFD